MLSLPVQTYLHIQCYHFRYKPTSTYNAITSGTNLPTHTMLSLLVHTLLHIQCSHFRYKPTSTYNAITSGTNLPPHARPPGGDEKTHDEVADHGDQHGEYEPLSVRLEENLLERDSGDRRQGGCGWNRVDGDLISEKT